MISEQFPNNGNPEAKGHGFCNLFSMAFIYYLPNLVKIDQEVIEKNDKISKHWCR